MQPKAIRPKVRDAIIQSLRAGVVPRIGQQYVQVGRAEEVTALAGDIERITDGGSAIRFIIGDYGSGKTFFLYLIRSIAMEKGLVACHADLDPDRRLHASGGQARSLYCEMMRNLATRSKTQGGALPSIVERFVTSSMQEATKASCSPEDVIHNRLSELQEMVGGYDFAHVVACYWKGHDQGNEQLKTDAIRWLRGEFSTKTDARQTLGVRTIIDDANVYDHLKLFARFTRLAGYQGFLVCLDELVNLYKLANTQARRSNYEQILRIFNDSLQGETVGLGFLMGGTPDFLMDPRRGLYSYEALQSRLAENTFLKEGMVDFSSPIVRLATLSPEDLYVLLCNLRHVYAGGDPSKYIIPDDALTAFLQHCSRTIGDSYFKTPRNSIKAFLDLLATLDQNPNANWMELLGGMQIMPDVDSEALPQTEEDDELASFTL